MRIEKRDNEWYYYGPEDWIKDDDHHKGNFRRTTRGVWKFEPHIDSLYSAQELLFIANGIENLYKS